MATGEQRSTAQISSSSNSSGRPVTPFWKEKYEREEVRAGRAEVLGHLLQAPRGQGWLWRWKYNSTTAVYMSR